MQIYTFFENYLQGFGFFSIFASKYIVCKFIVNGDKVFPARGTETGCVWTFSEGKRIFFEYKPIQKV